MYHPYYHSPANHPHSLNPIHPHIQLSGIPAMHLPFTPCSHAAASSACFASTPAPSVLLATTLTLSAFLNSVPSLILPRFPPHFHTGEMYYHITFSLTKELFMTQLCFCLLIKLAYL